MKRLLFALLLAGCGPAEPAPRAPRTPVEQPKPVDLADHPAAYARATDLAVRGDMEGAIAELAPFARATAKRDDTPLAYWIHNQLTWLEWGRGDLRAALAETEAGGAALDRSTLPKDKIDAMRLHALWDRAYLLIELHDPRASSAFADYQQLAREKNDHDGLAVLTAFVAARDRRAEDAAKAAREVDVDKDGDLQDLYVIALALEAAGDRERANAIRERICTAKPYLMKPLIVAQLAREDFHCR